MVQRGMGQLILLRFFCSSLKPISVRFILGFVLSVVQETLMVSFFFLPRFSSTGGLAQTVERSLCMREALGSIPRFSILFPL